MLFFHEKFQSLGHVKLQNLPCNTPLLLVLWPHPEPPESLKKQNLRLHGKRKVSLNTLIFFFFLFESSWKNMKNDTTFVRMHSGNHLGDPKMSKKRHLAPSNLTFFANCDRHKRSSQNERRRAGLQNFVSMFFFFDFCFKT